MGDSAIRQLQIGKHTGSPYTDTPGAFVSVDFVGEPIYPQFDEGKVRADYQRDDGGHAARESGAKSGSLSFETPLRGQGTAAGDGDEAAPPADLDLLFPAALGMAFQDGTGDESDADTHTTTSIKLTDTSLFYDGTGSSNVASGIMMDVGSGVYEAREVATVNSNTDLVPDRAFGAAPASAAVINAASSIVVGADDVTSRTATGHDHLYAKVEGSDWLDKLIGCGVTCSIKFAAKQKVVCAWSLSANDYSEGNAIEPLTYSSPASGIECLTAIGSKAHFGSTQTELIDGDLQLNFTVGPREATEGVNGQNGWLLTLEGPPTFSGRIYHTTARLAALRATSTQDFALQVGSAPGNAAYLRIPALDGIEAGKEAFNGVDVIRFSGECTRAASAGSVHLHIFGKASA